MKPTQTTGKGRSIGSEESRLSSSAVALLSFIDARRNQGGRRKPRPTGKPSMADDASLAPAEAIDI